MHAPKKARWLNSVLSTGCCTFITRSIRPCLNALSVSHDTLFRKVKESGEWEGWCACMSNTNPLSIVDGSALELIRLSFLSFIRCTTDTVASSLFVLILIDSLSWFVLFCLLRVPRVRLDSVILISVGCATCYAAIIMGVILALNLRRSIVGIMHSAAACLPLLLLASHLLYISIFWLRDNLRGFLVLVIVIIMRVLANVRRSWSRPFIVSFLRSFLEDSLRGLARRTTSNRSNYNSCGRSLCILFVSSLFCLELYLCWCSSLAGVCTCRAVLTHWREKERKWKWREMHAEKQASFLFQRIH